MRIILEKQEDKDKLRAIQSILDQTFIVSTGERRTPTMVVTGGLSIGVRKGEEEHLKGIFPELLELIHADIGVEEK